MLTLQTVFDNWNYDESMDYYWIESASHGFIVYLPDENTFIVNEGTQAEYTANIEEVSTLLNINNETEESKIILSDIELFKVREDFFKKNIKSAFRLEKIYNYLSGNMSERSRVEELAKLSNSILKLENNKYFIWVGDQGTGISKIGAEYFQFIKEYKKEVKI